MDLHQHCDESKCVSKGRSELFGGSHTCYGDDGTFFPRMCSDGFLPVVVDDEPSYFATPLIPLGQGYSILDYSKNITVQYFTCCPPDRAFSHNNITATRRHCSDPVVVNEEDTLDSICEDHNTRNIPRQVNRTHYPLSKRLIKSSWAGDAVLCCDSNNPSPNRDFLEDTECVPYHNELYEAGRTSPNPLTRWLPRYSPFHCETPGENFLVPRPLLENGTIEDVMASGFYRCCKTGSPLQPPIQDATFWVGFVVIVSLGFLAILASIMVSLGLSIPLLIQLKNGTYHHGTKSGRRRPRGPTYSTYNLYLVYLAIVDLVCSMYLLSLICLHDGERMPLCLISFNLNANLWLNAFLLHQVKILLQSFHSAERVDQPTLRRVSLQAGIAYFLATADAVEVVFRGREIIPLHIQTWYGPTLMVFKTFCQVLPIGYSIYVGVVVCAKGDLRFPSDTATAREKAKRDLAIYFIRIIAVFVILWLPAIACFPFAVLYPDPKGAWDWGLFYAKLICPIQSIVTTCVILTKKDCRKYIMNLVSMSYCCRSSNSDCVGSPTPTATNIDEFIEPSSNDDNDKESNEQSNGILEPSVMGDDNTTKTVACDEELGSSSHSYKSKRTRAQPIFILPTGELISGSVNNPLGSQVEGDDWI